MYDKHEALILAALDQAVAAIDMRRYLDVVVKQAELDLIRQPDAVMSWQPVPLTAYGKVLPPSIKSSWVFVLRSGATTGAERHPNSHQRVVSFRGWGDFQVLVDGQWQSNALGSEKGLPLMRRWASIPKNTWHQAVVPEVNWGVVSFHTALETELIEERPIDETMGPTRSRRYLAD